MTGPLAARPDEGRHLVASARGLRLRPWATDPTVAHLSLTLRTRAPSVGEVRRAVDVARSMGYRRVITSAVSDRDAPALVVGGFDVREELVVMARPVSPLDRRHGHGPTPIRIGRSHIDDVLRVDRVAFSPAWALDREGYDEAVRATPRARRRMIVGSEPIAYAICGRGQRRGYLQRLAVRPDAQGHGLGRRLVDDALAWLHRWRVRVVYVNTQPSNTAALALYAACGFTHQPSVLRVYEFVL